MNTKLFMKQHDLLPQFKTTLLDDTTPVDLSYAATARLILRSLTGIKVNQFMTITDQSDPANTGIVVYDWRLGDTDTAGSYRAEIEVVWQDGRPQTFPGKGYIIVTFVGDLDNPWFVGTGGIGASLGIGA